MRFGITARDGRQHGRDVDLLLDADPADALIDLLPQVLEALGDRTHPSFVAHVPVWVDGVAVEVGANVLSLREAGVRPGSVVAVHAPAAPALDRPAGVTELRVVNGPGAGRVHRLPLGETMVGCGASGLSLPDLRLPPHGLTVRVPARGPVTVTPADIEITLDGEPVTTESAWPDGALLVAGDTVLTKGPVERADGDVGAGQDHAGVDFNRPPRLLPPKRETRFTITPRPSSLRRRAFPWIMVVSPALMAVPMALIFHSYFFLVFAVLSPILALANYLLERRSGRREHRESLAQWQTSRDDVMSRMTAALVLEREERRSNLPDPASLLLTALGPGRRLWERRRTDPDHLHLRLGLSRRPATVELLDRTEGDTTVAPTHPEVDDVPVAADLRRLGVLGVAGDPEVAQSMMRWLVAQCAALHSPRDVRLVVLTRADRAHAWQWVRWLPHAHDDGVVVAALVGNDQESVGRRIAELSALVAARRGAGSTAAVAVPPAPDIVVVLDGARRLRALPGVVALLREGPAVGVHLLCLDDDAQSLPEECRGVVECGSERLVLRQAAADDVDDVRPDLVEPAWAERIARALGPIRDVSPADDDAGLPERARLLTLLALDPPTAEGVHRHWAQGATTEVVLGAGYDGPFRIDLRRDGPHALVAGTTGSGKSELLQTLVASLAVANRADELTFVLVDYKGGSAFAECARLPHTVGMVTDLDGHLVERALTSLGAELRRRERLLADCVAKDIEDYGSLRRRDPSLPPLPRLVLVIDEFAGLVAELPDFVAGLVGIAQRGRSLGIHLVLATQRPTGVVSAEIRANTNLRIALRVTDETESRDVIGAPEAARISRRTPGRGFARTGHTSLMPFQAGRVGGARPNGGASTRRPPLAWAVPWPQVGLPAPVRATNEAPVTDEGDTDLSDLVSAIIAADRAAAVPAQASPWLAALPAVVTTSILDGERHHTREPAPLSAAWGLEDHPDRQEQVARRFRLGVDGHLHVIGGPRSGRSTVLRTIAASLAAVVSVDDLHLYGLDCGNGALLPLESLPHTGAVIGRAHPERADRLLRRLSEEVDRRQEVLAAGGFADVTEQRAAAAPGEALPFQMLLLDRWEGFVATLGEIDNGRLTDIVLRLLREGASVGLHVIMCGDRSLLSGRISALVEHTLVLRMPDRSDYSLADLPLRKVPQSMPDGRGLWGGSAIELQVAMLDVPAVAGGGSDLSGSDLSGAGQAAAVRAIGEAARARAVGSARQPLRLGALPTLFPALEALNLLAASPHPASWVPLGIGGDDLDLLGLDLGASPVAMVCGPPRSGRTTALRFAARAAAVRGIPVMAVCPRPTALVDDLPPEAVMVGTSGTVQELLDHLRALSPGALVLVDDAEMLRDCELVPGLVALIRQAREKQWGVLVAGETAQLMAGVAGWVHDARRGRQGLLLCPQSPHDGEMVGRRLPHSSLVTRVMPGRGLLIDASSDPVTVQVPVAPTT